MKDNKIPPFDDANDQLDNWFKKVSEFITAKMMQEPVEFHVLQNDARNRIGRLDNKKINAILRIIL